MQQKRPGPVMRALVLMFSMTTAGSVVVLTQSCSTVSTQDVPAAATVEQDGVREVFFSSSKSASLSIPAAGPKPDEDVAPVPAREVFLPSSKSMIPPQLFELQDLAPAPETLYILPERRDVFLPSSKWMMSPELFELQDLLRVEPDDGN